MSVNKQIKELRKQEKEGGELIYSNKSGKTVQWTIFSDLHDNKSLAPARKRSSATPSAGLKRRPATPARLS